VQPAAQRHATVRARFQLVANASVDDATVCARSTVRHRSLQFLPPNPCPLSPAVPALPCAGGLPPQRPPDALPTPSVGSMQPCATSGPTRRPPNQRTPRPRLDQALCLPSASTKSGKQFQPPLA